MSNNASMEAPAEIRELSTAEVDAVSGAGFWDWLSGAVMALGAAVLLGGLFYNMPPGRIE
jgi:hypothetical protein